MSKSVSVTTPKTQCISIWNENNMDLDVFPKNDQGNCPARSPQMTYLML